MTDADIQAFATVVIVAAGRGERYGHPAKILELVGGRPVLEWSILAAIEALCVRDVVVVTGEHTEQTIAKLVHATPWPKPVAMVRGGERRQDSVAVGVDAVPSDREVVLIHDAARPLVESALFDACARAARTFGAAIAAVPVTDTLKFAAAMVIDQTVSRNGLWAAQTPQGFRLHTIRTAIEHGRTSTLEFTDDASMVEASGGVVHIVPGSRRNLKVTYPDDLELIDILLARRIHLTKVGEQ